MTKARDLGDFISDGTIAETVTADGLNLGDNEKIQLGASQDLQIYHSGTSSVIHDNGVGNLVLRADGLYINNAAGTENMVHAAQNGAVTLYYDNAAKLATSATGATVTGTIAVSDSFNATSGTFTVQSNGTDILNLTSTVMSPQTDGAISLGSSSNGFNELFLDGNAHVGTNSDAVWNGSSGTKLIVGGVNNTITSLHSNTTTVNQGGIFEAYSTSVTTGSPGLGSIAFLRENTSTTALNSYTAFYTNNAGSIDERMRIDSSGRVGIGSASLGDATLEIQPATDIPQIKLTQNNVGDGGDGWKFHNSGPTGGNLAFIREASGVDTEYMRITTGGNVGIGTASPSGNLQVLTTTSGTVANITHDTGGSYPKASGIGLGASSTSLSVSSDGSTVSFVGGAGMYAENTAASGNPTSLVFWTNASGTPAERFRIGPSGQLGIGGATYGTSGQVLTSGGSGAAPTWTTISAGAPFSGFGS